MLDRLPEDPETQRKIEITTYITKYDATIYSAIIIQQFLVSNTTFFDTKYF